MIHIVHDLRILGSICLPVVLMGSTSCVQHGGVRANAGITTGKFYFILKLLRSNTVSPVMDPNAVHACVVGVSERQTDVGALGMVPYSYGIKSDGNLLTGDDLPR
jgi:hypothetical protein